MNNYEDWRDGLLAYNESLWELDNEARRDRIAAHRRYGTTHGNGIRAGDTAPVKSIDTTSLRESWRTFVGDIVTPELAIHRLLFCTFTFENFKDYARQLDESPGFQKGRKAIEFWISNTNQHTDSYVLVEERGKANSRLHYHGLVRVLRRPSGNDLLLAFLRKSWTHGFTQVEDARDLTSASHYVTKYVLKGQYEASMGFWAKTSNNSQQLALLA